MKRTSLTSHQVAALRWFAEADKGRNWSTCRVHLHPWVFGSLANRGLIEDWNDPHRDEVWEITLAGRSVLQALENQKPGLADAHSKNPPEAATGWRDAATAPRTGQKVLACWAGRTNNMLIVWYEDWTWHAQIGGWQSVVMDEPPTHWMPLPAPPRALDEASHDR